MVLELFLVCFWRVKCLAQTDHFAEAIYSLCIVASFADFGKLVIRCFWCRFFAWNNLNVVLETFFTCFQQLQYLTIALAYAIALA